MNTKTIVIKIGTSSITKEDGTLNHDVISDICEATTKLKRQGHRIIIVSSGAIGAGMSLLKRTEKPADLPLKQAIAAVGQAQLIETYQQTFQAHNQLCAQILLTNDILKDQTKQKNVSQTLHTLHALEVIPIVNENDTVSTVELDNVIFSDNDSLSTIVSILVDADMLLLFSDVDGLYEKDQHTLSTTIVRYVEDIHQVKHHVSSQHSTLGRGGMTSKLNAIEEANKHGIDVILSNINTILDIETIIHKQSIGTFFKGGVKHGYELDW